MQSGLAVAHRGQPAGGKLPGAGFVLTAPNLKNNV
jgi:hypothetical protein